jgi:hypothetical protein
MFDTFKKLMFARQINFEEGRISLLNQPVMIVPVETFVTMTKTLRADLGRTKADEIIYKATKLAAIKYLNVLKKSFSMSKVDMIKWAANSLTLAGWGKITIIGVDGEKNRADIRVYDSSVAKGLGKDPEPTDIFLAGYFAGGETAVFGKDVDVKEIKCIAKGDQYCEFVTV